MSTFDPSQTSSRHCFFNVETMSVLCIFNRFNPLRVSPLPETRERRGKRTKLSLKGVAFTAATPQVQASPNIVLAGVAAVIPTTSIAHRSISELALRCTALHYGRLIFMSSMFWIRLCFAVVVRQHPVSPSAQATPKARVRVARRSP